MCTSGYKLFIQESKKQWSNMSVAEKNKKKFLVWVGENWKNANKHTYELKSNCKKKVQSTKLKLTPPAQAMKRPIRAKKQATGFTPKQVTGETTFTPKDVVYEAHLTPPAQAMKRPIRAKKQATGFTPKDVVYEAHLTPPAQAMKRPIRAKKQATGFTPKQVTGETTFTPKDVIQEESNSGFWDWLK